MCINSRDLLLVSTARNVKIKPRVRSQNSGVAQGDRRGVSSFDGTELSTEGGRGPCNLCDRAPGRAWIFLGKVHQIWGMKAEDLEEHLRRSAMQTLGGRIW